MLPALPASPLLPAAKGAVIRLRESELNCNQTVELSNSVLGFHFSLINLFYFIFRFQPMMCILLVRHLHLWRSFRRKRSNIECSHFLDGIFSSVTSAIDAKNLVACASHRRHGRNTKNGNEFNCDRMTIVLRDDFIIRMLFSSSSSSFIIFAWHRLTHSPFFVSYCIRYSRVMHCNRVPNTFLLNSFETIQ